MCKFNNGLKLCTCDLKEPNYTQDGYFWELYPLQSDFSGIQGRCLGRSEDIGEGLEHEWVELNLNCEDCFDFDYEPAEGDHLTIYKIADSLSFVFLTFRYANGLWCKGFFDGLQENKPALWGKVNSV